MTFNLKIVQKAGDKSWLQFEHPVKDCRFAVHLPTMKLSSFRTAFAMARRWASDVMDNPRVPMSAARETKPSGA